MKKVLAIVLALTMVLSLMGCTSVKSKIYTSGEIKDGTNTVQEYFEENFPGCTLLGLQYVGDERNEDFLYVAERNDVEEVMVFTSAVDADESGGNGSLKPNTSYEGWLWFLGRTDGGKWVTLESGY